MLREKRTSQILCWVAWLMLGCERAEVEFPQSTAPNRDAGFILIDAGGRGGPDSGVDSDVGGASSDAALADAGFERRDVSPRDVGAPDMAILDAHVLDSSADSGVPSVLVPVGETQGFVDDVDGGLVTGWFYERWTTGGSAEVHVYAHGPAGQGGMLVASGSADLSRPDVQTALGLPTTKVGFAIQLPPDFIDTMAQLHMYGIGTRGEPAAELVRSPLTSMGTPLSNANSPQLPPASIRQAWLDIHAEHVARAGQGPANVVFFGDSITFLMNRGTEPGLNNQTYGLAWWNQYIAPMGAANFGIGGDMTQNLIFRIHDDHLLTSSLAPKAVVILIGTNNVPSSLDSAADIADAIESITRLVRARAPAAKILLLDIFPRGAEGTSQTAAFRQKIANINNLIRPLSDGRTIYRLDLVPLLQSSSGAMRAELFANDGSVNLHPNVDGYEIILGAIRDSLRLIVPSLP